MREAQWKDYELIDCSCGERLERWGDIILIRPDPQVIFNTEKQIRFGDRHTQDTTAQILAVVRGKPTSLFQSNGRLNIMVLLSV